MNIIDVVEKCVELSVKLDNLNDTIEFCDKRIPNEEYKGNDSEVRYYTELQEHAKKNFAQAEQLFLFARKTFDKAMQPLDAFQLEEAAITVASKREDVKKQIADLEQRKNWSKTEGDTARNNHDYKGEKEYNHIFTACFDEIEKIQPMLQYYEMYFNWLNDYANKKVDQDFGPTR